VNDDLHGRKREYHRSSNARATEGLAHDEGERNGCQDDGRHEARDVASECQMSGRVAMSASVPAAATAAPTAAQITIGRAANASVGVAVASHAPIGIRRHFATHTHGSTPIK
jgi:hypothetical protein